MYIYIYIHIPIYNLYIYIYTYTLLHSTLQARTSDIRATLLHYYTGICASKLSNIIIYEQIEFTIPWEEGHRSCILASFDFRGCTAQASMFQLLAGHGWM